MSLVRSAFSKKPISGSQTLELDRRFPAFKTSDGQRFVRFLPEQYEVVVVPGEFFEMHQHFRIGIGGRTEMVRNGLQRLSQALEDFA